MENKHTSEVQRLAEEKLWKLAEKAFPDDFFSTDDKVQIEMRRSFWVEGYKAAQQQSTGEEITVKDFEEAIRNNVGATDMNAGRECVSFGETSAAEECFSLAKKMNAAQGNSAYKLGKLDGFIQGYETTSLEEFAKWIADQCHSAGFQSWRVESFFT